MGVPVLLKSRLNACLVAVGLQVVEEFDLGLDCRVGEVAAARGEVAFGEELVAVAGFHWVDEAGLLVVAQVGQSGNIERGHHLVVLVDQVMAVELDFLLARSVKRVCGMTNHVEAIPWSIACDDVDLFVGVEPDNILKSHCSFNQYTSRKAGHMVNTAYLSRTAEHRRDYRQCGRRSGSR